MRILFYLLLLCLVVNANADIQHKLTNLMIRDSKKVTSLLQDKNISQKTRDEQIIAIVSPRFDFDIMGKLSLGRETYMSVSKKEQQEYLKIFHQRIEQSYIDKLHLYNNQQLEFETAERVNDRRINLLSYIIDNNQRKKIIYKFYRSRSGKWLIYDINLLGVSIVQTYRNQFADMLQHSTFKQFLEKLRVDQL
jgi:phospholipid transport system substrate-binding protein